MKSEIVIARYSENLDWIAGIPNEFTVIVYNKGPQLTSRVALDRADAVVSLANSGRESDTILRHVLNKKVFDDGYTVFLQGDPFEHSPDIIGLLNAWRSWQDLQALSWRWIESKDIPPARVLEQETSTFLEGNRTRPELFSLSTWSQVQFFDPGVHIVCSDYLRLHQLPPGTNVASHFLHRCNWATVAELADSHLIGTFAYGALFAVRQKRLQQWPHRSIELALQAANAHHVYGYILERLWLHLCGQEFVLPSPPQVRLTTDAEARHGDFVAEEPRPHLVKRAVPGIKRRLKALVKS